MSTGSVQAIVPLTKQTQVVTPGTTSASTTFPPCDAVLLQNMGAQVVYVEFGQAAQGAPTAVVPSGSTLGSMPVAAGATVLVGTPGGAAGASPLTNIAYITSTSTSSLAITPVTGTQH